MKQIGKRNRLATPFFRFMIRMTVWGIPGILAAQLTSVTISPTDRIVNHTATHLFQFTTTSAIPSNGRLVVNYPAGFNLNGVNSASSSTMDGTFVITFSGSNVIVTRSGGTATTGGSVQNLQLSLVRNPTAAGTVVYTLRTENSAGGLIDQGSVADFIYAGTLNYFTFSGVPVSASAGQTFGSNIVVTARDQFGNRISNYTGTVTWTTSDPHASVVLPVDDGSGWVNGDNIFSGADFALITKGSQTLTVTDGAVSSVTSPINVVSGTLVSFNINAGISRTAGTAFVIGISNAQDAYGNTYSGSINIDIFSGGGNSPNGNPPTIPSAITVNNGSGTSGSVILTNAVTTQFRGTSGSVIQYAPAITVNHATLNSFSIAAGSPVTAGVSFPLQVTGAVDGYGNPWSGTIAVDATQGGTAAPNGTPPDYNPIYVNGGSGSALQKLVRTLSTTLRGQSSGISASTISLLVVPGVLHSFAISGEPAAVTAGSLFASGITITAFDAFGNTKTNYNGAAYFTSSDPQARLTYHSGNPYPFSSGNVTFPGSAFELRTVGSQTISIIDTAPNPDITKTSNVITVQAAGLSQFTMNCATTQIAGQPFFINIGNAQDGYGNPWSGLIAVTATQGAGNSPNGAVPNFNNIPVTQGTGQAKQFLVKAETGVTLQTQADGITRSQSDIIVMAGTLKTLKIRDAGGGLGTEVVTRAMIVNSGVTLFAAGYDIYGNYRVDEPCNWSSSGTLTPVVNASNLSSYSFSPTAPGTGTISVKAVSDTTVTDYTGTISVESGNLHHFTFHLVPTQLKDIASQIRVNALDAGNNIVSSFSGTVPLTDLTGTVQPTQLGPFENGVWIGNITMGQVFQNNRLTVLTSTGETGNSNYFDVVEGPGIRITEFQTLQSDTATFLTSVTTGQTRDWFVKISVENLGSGTLRLDSVVLDLKVNGILRNDYTILYPATFRGSGTNTIAGSSIDSLLIRVDATGSDAGPMTLEGSLYLRDIATGNPLPPDDASTSLTVQTPAVLAIQQVIPSRREVTRGQQGGWYVSMIVHNAGESELHINSNPESTGISFNIGTGWLIAWPENMAGGDWFLGGKETDSLLFNIEQTGNGQIGASQIQAFIATQELNTGRAVNLNKTATQTVLIEEPPQLRIISVRNIAENTPRVNTFQQYPVVIQVENAGGDRIQGVSLNFLSSLSTNGSNFPSDYPIGDLTALQQKTVTINASAGPLAASSEVVQVFGSGIAENTSYGLISSDPMDDTTLVVIQNPAKFELVSIIPTESQLLGGRVDEWRVKVAVRNPKTDTQRGQADFVINPPASTDLTFSILINQLQQFQEDYTVIAPQGLKSGGLVLRAGIVDTLVYRITATGRQGGEVTLKANLSGYDRNNAAIRKTATGSTAIVVTPEEKLRIISTRVSAVNMVSDVGFVNTNQSFQISVNVENGLGQSVRDIRIHISQNGQSSVADSAFRKILLLNPSKTETVTFLMTAATQPNLSGETFISSIESAKTQISGNPVTPGPAIDSTTKVIIHRPAQIAVELTSPLNTYSTNQIFTVTATLINEGDSRIDDSGIIQIFPPGLYTMVSTDTLHFRSGNSVTWQIRTPSIPQTLQQFSFAWYRKPRDMNSGMEAVVSAQPVNPLYISTVNSFISTFLAISNPEGARDDTLSTDQSFTVQAIVQWANTRDIYTTLNIPAGYTAKTKLEQAVNSVTQTGRDTLTWLIQAPSAAQIMENIGAGSRGAEAIQPSVPVIGQPVQPITVTTLPRVSLGLELNIIDPPDAMDGSLSLGQVFTVEARVTNHGEADTLGATLVTIDPLPRGYSISNSSLTKQIENGTARWVITAPTLSSVSASKIEAKIVQLPLDENTSAPAYVLPNQSSDAVAVTTESYLLAVGQEPLSEDVAASTVPGQKKVKLMTLSFDNRGVRGGNVVRVDAIRFDVEDLDGILIAPNSVISEAYVVDDENPDIVLGTTVDLNQDNPVVISLSNIKNIPVDGNPKLSILVDIDDTPTVKYFQLNIKDGSYISAKDANSSYPVPVKNQTEDDWTDLRSNAKYIYNPETESNLWSCPNPFSESTTVYYYIKERTDVTFRIFTLVGDPVWSSNLPDMPAGPHTLTWDGRNDNDVKILNGVYWLFMQTDQGVEGKFKIAVVK